MLKYWSIFALSLLTPIQSANAAQWTVSVPTWISTLAEKIGDKISNFTDETEKRKQVTCLALGVYYEARGESVRGQKAVASVIMNRVRSPRYPDTVCEVIFQPHQFSFVRRGVLTPYGASWNAAVEIGNEYIDKEKGDIPHLSFTNSSRIRGLRIGNHVFH